MSIWEEGRALDKLSKMHSSVLRALGENELTQMLHALRKIMDNIDFIHSKAKWIEGRALTDGESAQIAKLESELEAFYADLGEVVVEEYARRYVAEERYCSEARAKIECEDGFSMSVQAKPGAWCEPGGMDRYSPDFEPFPESYTHVEVGYPSAVEELLLRYAEDENNPTETVYICVPAHIILTVISKHGGMVGGELPPLKSDD